MNAGVPNPFGVFYDSPASRRVIFDANAKQIPENARFNVLVIKQ